MFCSFIFVFNSRMFYYFSPFILSMSNRNHEMLTDLLAISNISDKSYPSHLFSLFSVAELNTHILKHSYFMYSFATIFYHLLCFG